MTIPDLGTIEEVSLREAWHHEAQSFTPWLAQHLDKLAAHIGIPLELEGQEVAVDTCSADILARNPQDDSLYQIREVDTRNKSEENKGRNLSRKYQCLDQRLLCPI